MVAGGVNTVFGYTLSLLFYYRLHQDLSLVYILIITNIVSISISFLNYKIFVFKTPGNWIKEYLRCYLVYGFIAIISSILTWILVERISINFWIAQALTIITITISSYILHNKYTFKDANEKN